MQLFLVLVAIPVKGRFFLQTKFFFQSLNFSVNISARYQGKTSCKTKLFSAELPFELGNLAWNITLSCSKYFDGVDRHKKTYCAGLRESHLNMRQCHAQVSACTADMGT